MMFDYRCQCNGHARHCETVDIDDDDWSVKCVCEHNRTGKDCTESKYKPTTDAMWHHP